MDQSAVIDPHPADRRTVVSGRRPPQHPNPTETRLSVLGKRLVVSGVVLLALVIPLALVFGRGSSGPNVPRQAAASSAAAARVGRGSVAGAAQNGSLSWRILRSYTARRIQNAYVPSTARGTYLIMEVSALNTSGHPVALRPSQLDVRLDGTANPLDAAALAALELAGHKGLSTTDLAPHEIAAGWVVFDVAPRVAGSKPTLGLGSAARG